MYLYIDAETEVSKDLTLTKMTIRQYLARAKVLSVAFAQNDNPVTCSLSTDPEWPAIVAGLRTLVELGATVVAHNASFDVRVLTQSLGIPWPSKIHCTMEMAQGWSPNQPGGYGLDNLTRIWTPTHGKQKIDLQHCTPDELRAYNAQDVVACRALHKIALARMHPDEIRVMELTQNVKEIVFSVDQGKIADAVTAFDTQVAQHGVDAAAILGKSSSYGEDDDGSIRSVKPHALRAALLETLGFDTPTISMKKINPENLRQNPDAAKVLESSAKMNKALSHKRRVRAFAGATEIDAELTYFAAHTGRWSSRNSGRGLNLHNCVSVGIPLLTDRGWISILSLTPGDKVWDGTEFVSHQGVRLSPLRPLEPSIAACKVTPEHPVWTGDRMLARAALSPSLRVQSSVAGLCSLMRAAVKLGSTPSVMDAVLCALGQSQGYIRAAAADLAPTTPGTTTTGGVLIAPCSDLFGGDTTICFTDTAPKGMESFDSWETKCALAGATSLPSSGEYESMLAGMIQACTWIGSTARNRTDPVTLGSCLRWITRAIVALQSALPREKSLLITPNGLASSISPPTTSGGRDALYDVLGAGPRARYQAGGLIVSNCPKRNPAVAKPFRSLFRLPADLCFVRGDFANIEYRVCLAEGSLVRTDSGWKPIEKVTSVDKVWDGLEFVQHQGVICNGNREVIEVHGVWMTPDHLVLTLQGWRKAEAATMLPFRSVDAALVGGLLVDETPKPYGDGSVAKSCVSVAQSLTSRSPTYCAGSAENAEAARLPAAGVRLASSLMQATGSGGSINTRTSLPDATTPRILPGGITADGASPCIHLYTSEMTSFATSSPSQGGMIQVSPSTASTTTETTPQETCGALPTSSNRTTSGARQAAVYDIQNCGPRNRYAAGRLIVHNCGRLTGCAHTAGLFSADPVADPYAEFWRAATGQTVDKAVKSDVPKRQLAKAAVLGLSYMMGQQRWTHELSQSISDPTFKVTLSDLEQVCAANNWTLPADQRTRAIMGKLRCPPAVAAVAYYTREKFHQVHPEFGRCARGIEQTIQRAMGMSYDQKQSQRILDGFAMMPGIVFADDRGLQGQTIRARCGPWPADTIAWRDMLIRQTPIGTGPTFVRAGNKPVAKFTINTGIENLVQSAARNALCMGLLELDRRGFPYVLHVHDEVMIVTERTCAAVNAARQALLDVFGPGGWISKQGWEWSVLINPKETTLSQSLWDDEALSQTLWPRIAAGDSAALEGLT